MAGGFRGRALGLGLLLTASTLAGLGGAASDERGDASDQLAEHDIVEVVLAETSHTLEVTVTVAGLIEEPLPGVRDFRIQFRVTPGDLYVPGADPQPGGILYVVSMAAASNAYGVFRNGAFGYLLPDQPGHGEASATWVVPKAYLDATLLRRPARGDWIANVEVQARNTVMVDEAALPDVQLAVDTPAGIAWHLRAGPLGSNDGTLTRGAPGGGSPRTSTLWRDIDATFVSGALQAPLRLDEVSAVLWLSTTTTTPVLADEAFYVDVYDQAPGGQRTLVARRAETVAGAPADTNLFLVPGAPQRMPFRLLALPDAGPLLPGHKLVVRAWVTGVFSDEAGPVLVHFDSADLDSLVAVAGAPMPPAHHSRCPRDSDVPTGQVERLPRPQC